MFWTYQNSCTAACNLKGRSVLQERPRTSNMGPRKSRASAHSPQMPPNCLEQEWPISIFGIFFFLQIPVILLSEFVSRQIAAVYTHETSYTERGMLLGDLMLMKTAAWICNEYNLG